MNIWNILGIKPTTEKKEIQIAYGKMLATYHPEEFPEKFQEIQHAYKSALRYAKKPQQNMIAPSFDKQKEFQQPRSFETTSRFPEAATFEDDKNFHPDQKDAFETESRFPETERSEDGENFHPDQKDTFETESRFPEATISKDDEHFYSEQGEWQEQQKTYLETSEPKPKSIFTDSELDIDEHNIQFENWQKAHNALLWFIEIMRGEFGAGEIHYFLSSSEFQAVKTNDEFLSGLYGVLLEKGFLLKPYPHEVKMLKEALSSHAVQSYAWSDLHEWFDKFERGKIKTPPSSARKSFYFFAKGIVAIYALVVIVVLFLDFFGIESSPRYQTQSNRPDEQMQQIQEIVRDVQIQEINERHEELLGIAAALVEAEESIEDYLYETYGMKFKAKEGDENERIFIAIDHPEIVVQVTLTFNGTTGEWEIESLPL